MTVVRQREHDSTSSIEVEYFKGKKYLNKLINANKDRFREELEKKPIFALTGCLEVARSEYVDITAIELLVHCCHGGFDLNIAETVERCFFQKIEDPVLSHFTSCISSYSSIMGKEKCVEWLKDRVKSLGGSNAAHLILSMEVGKC